VGDQSGPRAHPRGRRRSFAPGVASSDYDDIERILHGRDFYRGFCVIARSFCDEAIQNRIKELGLLRFVRKVANACFT
jgi:hypothetical protein